MADTLRGGLADRDIEQAITALKRGAHLLKYGRRGKPKFCPFRLSNDESALIWYSGKEEKQIKLSQVVRIIPGQRTAIFQRYPRPEKEYQSFSLICTDRSLDLICKDKDEAEVWLVGLKALTNRGNNCKWRCEARSESVSSDSPQARMRRSSPSIAPSFDIGDTQGVQISFENPHNRLGKAFSDIISCTAAVKSYSQSESVTNTLSSVSSLQVEQSNGRCSTGDAIRVSLSSAVSSSSQGSFHEDFDAIGDVFIWGEGLADGMLGGGTHRCGNFSSSKKDALFPKALEPTVVLDVHNIACGGRHAVLVTKQGEIFSWGEESGGRLGHGVQADVSHPKLIDSLSGMNIELVACGEYHTCAVTLSGDLYTWGDGTHNFGLLGHGSEVSHWIPRKVSGQMEGTHVSYVSCGPWHTAAVTSSGQLFTFGDGSFGALGHGDQSSTSIPREVEIFKGMRTMRVACGVWHTAAVVEVMLESYSGGFSHSSSGKLFTWGDGDKGRLGHGDEEPKLLPECVVALVDENICQVACGYHLTIALTALGHVYTMGSAVYGQLGSPVAAGRIPARVEDTITERFVEVIACGSHHVAVMTSKAEVYTWGKGANGQLGHGDNLDRNKPTLVESLKDKQVKSVVCGSNFTAIICPHKWSPSVDHSVCSGCHNPFGFRRKRHNCYNCGLVFCKACSSKKSMKASLAPNVNKPYRVCDDCFTKLKSVSESSFAIQLPKVKCGSVSQKLSEVGDKETQGLKLPAELSKLASFGSSNQAESRYSKNDMKLEVYDSRLFRSTNGNLQCEGFHPSRTSTSSLGDSRKLFSISIPGSILASRATSPVSVKSSLPRSSEVTLDDPKHRNDTLSKEIINLRAQVEDLTCKSQLLEAELERTSKQLKEVSAIATDEAEKHKSAKDVIKTLTAQLKEMAKRLPEGQTASTGKHTSNFLNLLSSESQTDMISPECESNGNSVNQISCNGTKALTEKPERVLQDEPGVYVTLSSLPGGGNELRRIRFSRKHFTEEQAEKWWSENGTKLCERHNIRS